MELIPDVRQEAFKRINHFLHPLTGGDGGKGWPFGKLPAESDFSQLLQSIEELDNVQTLDLEFKGNGLDEKGEILPHALVCSGTHNIRVKDSIINYKL